MTGVPPLPAQDLAILRFAGEWWHNAAAKERAIAERFGIPPIRFYQLVNRLIDEPAAQAAEPLITARLRRIRDTRRTRIGRHPTTARSAR